MKKEYFSNKTHIETEEEKLTNIKISKYICHEREMT
jgi:hypothetical protein